jgi:hypothetical protein
MAQILLTAKRTTAVPPAYLSGLPELPHFGQPQSTPYRRPLPGHSHLLLHQVPCSVHLLHINSNSTATEETFLSTISHHLCICISTCKQSVCCHNPNSFIQSKHAFQGKLVPGHHNMPSATLRLITSSVLMSGWTLDTLCSFSPSIYAQGDCFLMHRNCDCNWTLCLTCQSCFGAHSSHV